MFTKIKVLGITIIIVTIGIIKPSQAQPIPSNIVNQNNSIHNSILSIERHYNNDFFLEGQKKLETEINILLNAREKKPTPLLKIKTETPR